MKSVTPQDEIGKVFATAVELHQKGHLHEAESLYRAILAIDSKHADALHLAGVAAHQRSDHATAADMIRRAIVVRGDIPQFHFHLGVALQASSELPAAAQSYRNAIRLKPDFGSAWENLGVALQDADQLDAAREAYERALSIDPTATLAHQNLGTLLFNIGKIAPAQTHFEAVLAVQPAQAEARAKYASTLLAQARYDEGWREHEWRHHSNSLAAHYRPRLVPFPKWDGSPLTDKTLLIHPEQGIGEELLFASCYSDAIACAARTIIECDPRLTGLFARSFPAAQVIAGTRWEDFIWTEALGSIDFRVPAGSLPRFFRRESAQFPRDGACLRVDSKRHAYWRTVLDRLDHPINIGISWTGGKDPRAAKARSIPLAEWRSLFEAIDANFINIQYGDHDAEIAAFNRSAPKQLHTLAGLDLIKDPDDGMALIAALDLVISIDNSTVFMAGSIGTPVWVLLPPNGEWRWRGDEDRSPWYPAARLFRQAQSSIESWRRVLGDVALELATRGATLQRAPDGEARLPRFECKKEIETSPSPAARALLINDTRSWYHWGCSCTSLALHTQLRRRSASVDSVPIQRLVQISERPMTLGDFDDDSFFERFSAANADVIAQLQRAETVFVNGEGTLHGVSAQSLSLLYVAYIAKRRFGHPVHIINHSCYPDDTDVAKDTPAFELYRRVYRVMDFIAVREPVSAQLMKDVGITATEAFDCLPLFVRDHKSLISCVDATQPRSVVIAGSAAWGASAVVQALGKFIVKLHGTGLHPVVLIGADAHLAADDVQFVTTLQRVAGGHFQLRNATSELEWLRSIADARLLVSGRFHHSIAAACLGTPFLLMESNTPKIAGLLQRLGADAFVSTLDASLSDTLFRKAQAILSRGAAELDAAQVITQLTALADLNFKQPL